MKIEEIYNKIRNYIEFNRIGETTGKENILENSVINYCDLRNKSNISPENLLVESRIYNFETGKFE